MRAYINCILSWRKLTVALALSVTVALLFQITHLKIIIDTSALLPQAHPYVVATNKVEALFGSKYVVVIGISPRQGDIFQPQVLQATQRITAALMQTPGVIKGNLVSLAARKAKSIIGTEDGFAARQIMPRVPQSAAEFEELRRAVQISPAYQDFIVSRDNKTTAIFAEFADDPEGFNGIINKVTSILDKEKSSDIEIALGGIVPFLSLLEIFSLRWAFFFPLAILVVGLIHFEAFRTIQGLLLPLVTALLAVAWGLGVMGWLRVPLDVFNVTTPILILAIAAGHAVQLLKRYYEEYYRVCGSAALLPAAASRLAVVQSVVGVGAVMIAAGAVAALGFLSLAIFEVRAISTFGIFTGVGVISALILEMTFTPALRSLLPAPGPQAIRQTEARVWSLITETIANWIEKQRAGIYLGIAALVLISLLGASRVVIDNSIKSFFAQDIEFQESDRRLNEKLGGTNTLYVLVEGDQPDAIKAPAVLHAIEAIQRFVEQRAEVGKTISLVDFVKRMNQAAHGDDPAYFKVPDDRSLVAQYLLLYSMSGEPGDFDSFVDNDYRAASITVFLKTDSSAVVQELIASVNAHAAQFFPPGVRVAVGGSVAETAALNDAMVRGKVLNVLQFSIVVLVISAIVLRSWLGGVLVVIPLLLTFLANFGLMGWSGMLFNIPNALSATMVVGIGADYAIYLIFRLREELARPGVSEAEAFREALRTAGKACLFVAAAVIGGYGVLYFSFGFYVHTWLATLIGASMLVSVFVTLTLVPALILTFRPKFVFGARCDR